MPFRRRLPDDLVTELMQNRMWQNICNDSELTPEIRNNKLTVYYRGRALIRELRLKRGCLVGFVHHKFVPLSTVDNESLPLRWINGRGLTFVNDALAPRPLGLADQLDLAAYKRLMTFEAGPEDNLHQLIDCRRGNVILDQQVEFPGLGHNKIDICYFDRSLSRICFAEIKRFDDLRLVAPTDTPEVIGQLQSYGTWLQRYSAAISEAYREVIRLKYALNPNSSVRDLVGQQLQILTKPILIIGNCGRTEVKQISDSRHANAVPTKWTPLWQHVRNAAAGLILCGENGSSLSLLEGRQRFSFI
jgi:hypothetical protein